MYHYQQNCFTFRKIVPCMIVDTLLVRNVNFSCLWKMYYTKANVMASCVSFLTLHVLWYSSFISASHPSKRQILPTVHYFFQQNLLKNYWLCRLMFKFADANARLHLYYNQLKLYTVGLSKCLALLILHVLGYHIEIQSLLYRLNCFVQHYNESAYYALCCVFTDQPETKKVATNDGKMLVV